MDNDIWLIYITDSDDVIVHSSIIGYQSFDKALAEASIIAGNAKAEFDTAGFSSDSESASVIGVTFNDLDGGQIIQVTKVSIQ